MNRKTCGDQTPHTHHLTQLGRLALRLPGVLAWSLALRAGVATKACSAVVS